MIAQPFKRAACTPLLTRACQPVSAWQLIVAKLSRGLRALLVFRSTAFASAAVMVLLCLTGLARTSPPHGCTSIERTEWMVVKQLAEAAYPRWQAAHPERVCPRNLHELAPFMSAVTLMDEFGQPRYVMLCRNRAAEDKPNHFGVIWVGEDRAPNTDDDVASWYETGSR